MPNKNMLYLFGVIIMSFASITIYAAAGYTKDSKESKEPRKPFHEAIDPEDRHLKITCKFLNNEREKLFQYIKEHASVEDGLKADTLCMELQKKYEPHLYLCAKTAPDKLFEMLIAFRTEMATLKSTIPLINIKKDLKETIELNDCFESWHDYIQWLKRHRPKDIVGSVDALCTSLKSLSIDESDTGSDPEQPAPLCDPHDLAYGFLARELWTVRNQPDKLYEFLSLPRTQEGIPLFMAIAYIKMLNINPNQKITVVRPDKYNPEIIRVPLLLKAARDRNMYVYTALLHAGAKKNCADENGKTVLDIHGFNKKYIAYKRVALDATTPQAIINFYLQWYKAQIADYNKLCGNNKDSEEDSEEYEEEEIITLIFDWPALDKELVVFFAELFFIKQIMKQPLWNAITPKLLAKCVIDSGIRPIKAVHAAIKQQSFNPDIIKTVEEIEKNWIRNRRQQAQA